jgi:N-methylhydantoinase A/oxoprolinase/acetone carboxylase beta subunit
VLVGVDTGGTFTDLVADDGTITKIPSTPDDPGRAVAAAIDAVGDGTRPARLAHGTTVATNALLERRGATVALVTNAGFEDLLEIARQDRPSLYDGAANRPEPLVPRHLRFGVTGRLAADGTELVPVDPAEVAALDLPDGVEAVAVCLLHADLTDDHERAVAEALTARGFDVTRSVSVSPEFREYERALTTTVNAYLRPVCGAYLRGIGGLADEVLVLSSAGGLLPVDVAAALPAALLLSGPAGGGRGGGRQRVRRLRHLRHGWHVD